MRQNIPAARRWLKMAEAERRLALTARCNEAHDECVTNAHNLERNAYYAAPRWIRKAHPDVWEVFQPTPGPVPAWMAAIPIVQERR